jgi:hypothetical protein
MQNSGVKEILIASAENLVVQALGEETVAAFSVIKNWMLVPLTLRSSDFTGLATHACKRLQSGKRLENKFIFTRSHEQLRKPLHS